jgi:NADPH-dependent 2,4-dienoyl-CoA reductase/sulfur reductase-like enzyme/nitrite reductase/ring-hydroxylating ferredoxin subunit
MQKITALADLAEARPQRIKLGDTSILLIRSGDTVHAFGADCPHAGAPLEEGAVCNGRLICPWHKGTFDIATGALVEPPPLLPLTRYPVRIDGGDVLVSTSATEPAEAEAEAPRVRTQASSNENAAGARVFAVVGAGAAGAAACAALREFGYRDRIVLIDDEAGTPYDRTVLSKFVPSGDMAPDDVPPLLPDDYFEHHRIERIAARVTRLDAERREIGFAAAPSIRYDAALVATGGTPKRPALRGADHPAVKDRLLMLRNRADSAKLVAMAEHSAHVVVLGGSFIGLEIASSLGKRKLRVTVVSPESVPFEKQFGAELGRLFMRLHEANGTEFRMNAHIDAVDPGEPLSAILTNGDTLRCDFIVVGTGVTPATDFISGVTRNEDGGLNVDASMRAAEGLYAAGDIAAFMHGDGKRIRIEHWRVAQQLARSAARAMVGLPAAQAPVPFFWTYHFDKTFEYLGHAKTWDETVMSGTPDTYEFIALLCKHGYVAAVVGCSRERHMGLLAEALREPLSRDDALRLIGGSAH